VHCDQYDETLVQQAVQRGIDLLGGITQFISQGESILLKPNVLSGSPPEKCVTTHPLVCKAVAACCLQAGATVSIGDSPGRLGKAIHSLKKAGLLDVAQSLGLHIADFDTGTTVSFPEGSLQKQFTIAKGVLAANGLISLPKMKTHGLMRITGAIKNQFGCIPGLLKGEFHFKLPNTSLFAQMLVDLTRFLKPRMYILDGIIAMEGNGPGGGAPKSMNVLLFSTDPAALDATFCRLIGLDPQQVLTLQWAEKLGLGTYHADQIELVGDPGESFQDLQFDVGHGTSPFDWDRGAPLHRLLPILKHFLSPRPVITPSLCTRCGTCVQMCPVTPKAVDFHPGDRSQPPMYMYTRCIRCYCCQELCPESAIAIRVPWLGRLIHP
jgi:uncharacterized protein (DUF362 family)/Pyruvate/2-oxoacid:ferredoxin oxidoreductase delta subunit